MEEALAGLSELQGTFTSWSISTNNIAAYIAATFLLMGLMFVIWTFSTERMKGFKYLFIWMVALIFTVLFI